MEKELAFLWSETPDALFYDIQVSTVENYAVRAIDQGGIQTGVMKQLIFYLKQNTFGMLTHRTLSGLDLGLLTGVLQLVITFQAV